MFIYYFLLAGVGITALYSFRMFFLVFHGETRMPQADVARIHESPSVITLPLIVLALPSIFLGALLVEDFLFKDFFSNIFLPMNILKKDNVIGLLA